MQPLYLFTLLPFSPFPFNAIVQHEVLNFPFNFPFYFLFNFPLYLFYPFKSFSLKTSLQYTLGMPPYTNRQWAD